MSDDFNPGEKLPDQPPEQVLQGLVDEVKRITAEIEINIQQMTAARSTKQPHHLEAIQTLLQSISHKIDRYKDHLNHDDSPPEE